MLSIRSSCLKQLRRGISNGSTKEIRWIDILPIHDHRSDRESNQSRVVERELNLDRPLTITEDDEFRLGVRSKLRRDDLDDRIGSFCSVSDELKWVRLGSVVWWWSCLEKVSFPA